MIEEIEIEVIDETDRVVIVKGEEADHHMAIEVQEENTTTHIHQVVITEPENVRKDMEEIAEMTTENGTEIVVNVEEMIEETIDVVTGTFSMIVEVVAVAINVRIEVVERMNKLTEMNSLHKHEVPKLIHHLQRNENPHLI